MVELSTNKLHVFDVSDPTSPTEPGASGGSGLSDPQSVAVQGNYATGDLPVSDENKNEDPEKTASDDAGKDAAPEPEAAESTTGGPKFTEAPGDPLAGVKKGASDVMASMEGKTVSMKVYVGSIIGVIVLMLLARCGG